MYFRLKHGVHLENGKRYETVYERDDKGTVTGVTQPVLQSDADLVARFGADKFERLSEHDSAVQTILLTDEKSSGGATEEQAPDPATSVETVVEKAVKKGAVEIAEPPGKDVTNRFDGAKDTGLKIYRKKAGEYIVCSPDDKILTDEPISKTAVEKLIDEWSE